jgi:hypothetical protein
MGQKRTRSVLFVERHWLMIAFSVSDITSGPTKILNLTVTLIAVCVELVSACAHFKQFQKNCF